MNFIVFLQLYGWCLIAILLKVRSVEGSAYTPCGCGEDGFLICIYTNQEEEVTLDNLTKEICRVNQKVDLTGASKFIISANSIYTNIVIKSAVVTILNENINRLELYDCEIKSITVNIPILKLSNCTVGVIKLGIIKELDILANSHVTELSAILTEQQASFSDSKINHIKDLEIRNDVKFYMSNMTINEINKMEISTKQPFNITNSTVKMISASGLIIYSSSVGSLFSDIDLPNMEKISADALILRENASIEISIHQSEQLILNINIVNSPTEIFPLRLLKPCYLPTGRTIWIIASSIASVEFILIICGIIYLLYKRKGKETPKYQDAPSKSALNNTYVQPTKDPPPGQPITVETNDSENNSIYEVPESEEDAYDVVEDPVSMEIYAGSPNDCSPFNEKTINEPTAMYQPKVCEEVYGDFEGSELYCDAEIGKISKNARQSQENVVGKSWSSPADIKSQDESRVHISTANKKVGLKQALNVKKLTAQWEMNK